MGVDQISKHDHSSDSEGGEDISPTSISADDATVGGFGMPTHIKRIGVNSPATRTVDISNIPNQTVLGFRGVISVATGDSYGVQLRINDDSSTKYNYTVDADGASPTLVTGDDKFVLLAEDGQNNATGIDYKFVQGDTSSGSRDGCIIWEVPPPNLLNGVRFGKGAMKAMVKQPLWTLSL
jgi:hypothetical protein